MPAIPGSKKYLRLLQIATILLVCATAFPCTAAVNDAAFDKGIDLLLENGFPEKEAGIEELAGSGDARCPHILEAMLAGRLYYIKKDKTLVYAVEEEGGYRATDVLTDKDLGSFKKRKLRKVSINNRLRNTLAQALARLRLRDPDPGVRLHAINEMMPSITLESRPLLADLYTTEADGDVKEALTAAMSILDLRGRDKEARLTALEELTGNLNPLVRNELTRLVQVEKDLDIQKKAGVALNSIESRISFFALIEKIFFGLSLGSVLVIAAIGLAITFGVVGVINMAHGELIMLGSYTAFVLQQLLPDAIGVSLLLAIPAAFLVSGIVGILIEKTVIRFLYGRPLETLLATFGVSLVLQQMVRSIFSPLNRSVASPHWMSGSIQINAVLSLTNNRLIILAFSLLVFSALFFLLKKSPIGLQVRAVSQNRAMARAMGIRAVRVDALTFGLGSGIAGIAGVALSQLTNVGPNLGQAYIVDSFMVVVFGGVGNLWGTLLGGLSLGIVNKFLEPWTGAVLAKILILVLIILFIQKRPQGLFPQKGRVAG